MKEPRWLAVAARVFMDLKNDKRTLALIIIAPVFAMLLFGFAFSGQVHDVKVCVVNLDTGAQLPDGTVVKASDKVIANLDTEIVDLVQMSDVAAAKQQVEDGDAYGALVFPADFSQAIASSSTGKKTGQVATIQLYLDESNVNVAQAITSTVNEALQKTMAESGLEPPVKVSVTAVYGKNAEFIDFFVPGIMGFAVFMLTTMLTLISFVGERTSGTLERLLSTPLAEWQIVLGYAVAFGVVGIVQSAILLLVGILVFKITIVGNVFMAFVVIAILAVAAQGLGILLSSLAKRESQVVQFLPLIILPTLLLSGVIWPVEAIPSWLQPVSYVIPVTYAVNAARSVMLRGWGITQVWFDVLILIAFAVAFPVLATISLKLKKS